MASRRAGYLIAIAVNIAAWYAINTWPGWAALPFLTPDTTRVLGLVNAAIVVSIVTNAIYVLRDPRWTRALGDLIAGAIALLALMGLWQVFPFAFDGSAVWPLVARTALVFGMAGCGVSIVVQLAVLLRAALGTDS